MNTGTSFLTSFSILCLFLIGLLTQNGHSAPGVEETFFQTGQTGAMEQYPFIRTATSQRGQPSTTSRQHALVMGVNQYRYADSERLRNLAGAVNDAKLLAKALRQANVDLPDQRILLDAKATRAEFIRAWQEMVRGAKPGDTLILTFSGHGGQQTDTPPLDEADQRDETLMLHDFKQPNEGRIIDDELYGMFQEASAFPILFIVDSCHSSGMVRAITGGRSRAGGSWDIPLDTPPPSPPLPMQPDDQWLPHVTLLTSVDTDSLEMKETAFNNQPHGALSWFFAQAIAGQADGNQDGQLDRGELERFLQERVSDQMKNQQKPKLIPRGDTQVVFTLPTKVAFQPPSAAPALLPITVIVQNGQIPQGLEQVTVSSPDAKIFRLRFVIKGQQTEVFNELGDKVTTVATTAKDQWQRLIHKERLLQALASQFDMRLKPIRMVLQEGDRVHKRGEQLHFSVSPGDAQEGLNALTLFNLAGNGELQFLYPLPEFRDPLTVQRFPHHLPPTEVAPPFGGDDLVAVLCQKPLPELHTLLGHSQPLVPDPEAVISRLQEGRCQVGQYAFFSGE